MNKEPMVRKQERREKIDEAIIINLIGGWTLHRGWSRNKHP